MSRVMLLPAGRQLMVARGTALRDVLFEQGVEFPCGGGGRCKGCRVKLLAGALTPDAAERERFTAAELTAGWRLACRHGVDSDLTLELAQWEMPVLSDHSAFSFVPQTGLGIAIDLGTTTIAAQLLDLTSGHVLAARTALNAQARHGDDIMSRIAYALQGGAADLTQLIRAQLGQMIAELAETAPSCLVIVGNTVMHHLFCGIDVTPLATHPFLPEHKGRIRFTPSALGWNLPETTSVEFLPCIGGMVGADILAGIIATDLHKSEGLVALMDLGTNGEVVLAGQGRLLCTSTAAGPAFEGARISMGMRAASGAISEITLRDNAPHCRVIGGGAPRGLCGSGLVDAVAAGLDLGVIEANGRMRAERMMLAEPVTLSAQDVRQLQLAKGAIAAGLKILTAHLGATPSDIDQLYLAGAFGNCINRVSAERIGLVRGAITSAGNTALLGAKRALFEDTASWEALADRVEHIALSEEPDFSDIFAEEMRFPD
ncbi:MAG: ASKHA domain-containing protein [Rhizomicrobium sp.]|nr:ASKHA domain-containing protein [Rhizomicrobium sp.]